MDNSPTVSVVIPVYNGERYLEEALDSAVNQTRAADEILVFDNASTDESVNVALSILGEAALRHSVSNHGAPANFNRAVRESTGDLVLWLAADDRLAPRHLESCVRLLQADPAAPGCLPGVRFIDDQGNALRETHFGPLASADPGRRLRSFLRSSRWTEFYALYRRDALLASPMSLDEYGFDVLLTWWFLLRGPFAVTEEPLLEYREYPDKSVDEMAKSIDPQADTIHWRKIRMWIRLWSMTREDDLSKAVRSAARRELATCLLHPTWQGHLAEDVTLRWPATGRWLYRLRKVRRSPWRRS